MKLSNADDLAHLSDAERFKAVMKRLVSVTPEQIVSAEKELEAENPKKATRKSRASKDKSR